MRKAAREPSTQGKGYARTKRRGLREAEARMDVRTHEGKILKRTSRKAMERAFRIDGTNGLHAWRDGGRGGTQLQLLA